MEYKPTIGLEIHAELKTKTKMFCDSLNDPDEKHPNMNVCPICMGHPGTLPVINQEAVKKVIMAGLALNCKIADESFFERKNYFYPDLPKGYQISQYQKPLCEGGYLDIPSKDQSLKTKIGSSDGNDGFSPSSPDFKHTRHTKRIRIERIHLEEDAGRLLHDSLSTGSGRSASLVDYNRAGVPLMELVTRPDLETAQDVKNFAEELQLILRYLGISDANMEKGQMRVEVNISVSKDEKLGIKVEVKNLNSIKVAMQAVEYETKRQIEAIENGERIIQETRGWDDIKRKTVSQRIKEGAHDYRYFPEPDLPPLSKLSSLASELLHQLPELPQQRRERFAKEYELPDYAINIFTVNKQLGDYFEKVISELRSWDRLSHIQKPAQEHELRLIKLSANYLITELQKLLYERGFGTEEINNIKITPENFAEFIVRLHTGEVSSSGAQLLLKEMFETGAEPKSVIKDRDLGQVSDLEELTVGVKKVLTQNTKAVEDFKKGKIESLKFLVGQVMRETKGKANPVIVEEILKKEMS